MAFSWQSTGKSIVALAPMAGVTDASYRQTIKLIAPRTVVFSEFLSTNALSFGAKRTKDMLAFDAAIERPFIVQVFGADPDHFVRACRLIEEIGADGIDINMGCPAAKIVSSCYGSALIRDTKLAMRLVESAVKTVNIPVSVKTRLGWDNAENLIPFCSALVEAGASALSIHGRSYTDKFTGAANWEPIYALKNAVSVPVIGNGDIASVQDALEKIGNLDGVMVGRGTFGNPWLLADIMEAFDRRAAGESDDSIIASFTESADSTLVFDRFRSRTPFIIEHCKRAIALKGEERGIREMRRHFSSYAKGFDGAKELRMRLLGTTTMVEVEKALRSHEL